MRFGERILNLVEQKKNAWNKMAELRALDPGFEFRDRTWLYNREVTPGDLSLKVRFGFDDPTLLRGCSFYSKIGFNIDPAVRTRYIGFSYGNRHEQAALEGWGKKFPFAELISGLDRNAVSTPESEVTSLK